MRKILILISTLIVSMQLYAGDKIGNGGGLWICPRSGSVEKGSLIDLFEGREQYGLTSSSFALGGPMQIVMEKKIMTEKHMPLLFSKIESYLNDTLSKMRFISADLVIIDDALYVIQPQASLCKEAWKYVQFANYTTVSGQILINEPLWNNPIIADIDKAALVWHEAIYHWLRDEFGAQNSIQARYIIALLFSDLDPKEIYKDIYWELYKSSIPSAQPPADPRKLYVTSGACNSGPGVITYNSSPSMSASRSVTTWNLQTGEYESKWLDWNTNGGFINSFPQQIIKKDYQFFVLSENSEYMPKRQVSSFDQNQPSHYNTIIPRTSAASPQTARTHINRNIKMDQGVIAINRTVSIEKFNVLGSIVLDPSGTTSFINPSVATGDCFATGALTTGTVTAGGTYSGISDIALLPPIFGQSSGKIIFANMGSSSKNNRLGASIAQGMTSGVTAHCAGGVQISNVVHTLAPDLCPSKNCRVTFDSSGVSPTSILFIPTTAPTMTTGKLIVAYAPSNTSKGSQSNSINLNHAIVMWDVTESSSTSIKFDRPVVLNNDDQIIIAPSAMAYDEKTSSLYVAVGTQAQSSIQTTGSGYNIEKFELDMTTPKLTRIATKWSRPFMEGNSDTKCISGLTIAD